MKDTEARLTSGDGDGSSGYLKGWNTGGERLVGEMMGCPTVMVHVLIRVRVYR